MIRIEPRNLLQLGKEVLTALGIDDDGGSFSCELPLNLTRGPPS